MTHAENRPLYSTRNALFRKPHSLLITRRSFPTTFTHLFRRLSRCNLKFILSLTHTPRYFTQLTYLTLLPFTRTLGCLVSAILPFISHTTLHNRHSLTFRHTYTD